MKKNRHTQKYLKKATAAAVLAGAVTITACPSAIYAAAPAYSNDASELADITKETAQQLESYANPVVQEYTADASNKMWTMTSSTRLVILANQENTENERLAEVVKLVNSEFMEKEIVSSSPFAMVYGKENDAAPPDILITVDKENPICEESDSEEAYRIDIDENGVRLVGASENAVMYGLRTIQNMMVTNNGLVYGTIIDYPDMPERRLHVDCARKYISKDWFIRQIREMSYLKMNTLQMHFSENLGFRIECETDPQIVSKDGYLTKDEVREILAEAKKYGIKVIPSFDTPGHVDQILKAHPEYGQISNTGSHYKSGLDITNPEAVAYIRSLYEEYMELFEGCTDFHIGGDEYMEFDRAPFTTQYKSVLNEYAKETLGDGYIWKDAMANYINEMAEFVHDHGFTPRVFNDGLYYGENDWEGPQKIKMHDYIGVDFWSQMTWNPSIARLKTFIDKGHDTIYNFNSSFFYYVLRNDKPTDGRPQNSFDVKDQDKNIYENWTPGNFPSNPVSDDSSFIKGASMGIWCDNPNIVTEDVITEDIADELRSLASKSWNTDSNSVIDFQDFQANYKKLGNVAGFEKGSALPDPGEILAAESLGKVTLRYVSDTGKVLKDDVVKYGTIGENYSFEAEDIYGYKLISEDSVSGTYEKEGDTFTFVYTLNVDKSELKKELDAVLPEDSYIKETYADYKETVETAKEVAEREDSEQTEVDAALKALQDAKAKAVPLSRFALYVETQYPLEDDGYVSGYTEYKQAVADSKEILYNTASTDEMLQAAFEAIQAAKGQLMKPDGNTPSVSASLGYYTTYVYTNMLDGNLSSKCWFNGDQATGDDITFTFPQTVNMSKIQISQPSDVGNDVIDSADIQISTDGEEWTTVGTMDSGSLDTTVEFTTTPVKYARILLTADKKNWYQISEVQFTYEQIPEDHTLRDLIETAEGIDMAGKDSSAVSAFVDVLIEAQKAYASHAQDTEELEMRLQAAMDALDSTEQQKLSTSVLEYALKLAQTADTTGVVTSVAEKFEALKAQAEDILLRVQQGDKSVTQEMIDETWQELVKTMQYFSFKQGDKTDLSKVIALAESLDLSLYLAEGQDAFEKALNDAIIVRDSGDAMQEDVNASWKALLQAMSDLRLKPNKDALKVLIASAQNLSLENAKKEDALAFRTALANAQSVYADEEATKEEVNLAASELDSAISRILASAKTPHTTTSDPAKLVSAQGSNTQKNAADTSTVKSAKTGDTTTVAGMAALAAVAGGLAAATIKKRKKYEN